MRVFSSQYELELPRDPDELVTQLFDQARKVLIEAKNHRPTVITLFAADTDHYRAHYHVLVPDRKGEEMLSVKPIIDAEKPDAFAMISLSEVKVSGKRGKAHPEGAALFLVFHSNQVDRMQYETYTASFGEDGKPNIKMGKMFKTDRGIDLLGFGNLSDFRLDRPSYLG